jgi:pyridinium-3,5-biscarboxylic acid mononucleotide sulfurtransferase
LKTEDKLAQLKSILNDMGSVLVAYSGGVDSTFLAYVANQVLGPKALAVFGHSPVCPPSDLEDARSSARQLGLNYREIETDEMADPRFVANTPERCYFCKQGLFQRLKEIAAQQKLAWIADGTNFSDQHDYRPGLRACREAGIRSPLLEAGLGKNEIRQISRDEGLPTWDRPASPCLASRIPYGTAVTAEILQKIAAGEEFLHNQGFKQVRLRHHGDIARIEVDEKDMPLLFDDETRRAIIETVRSLGYLYVTLDLDGYRTGSLNEGLKGAEGTGVDGN